MTTHSEKAAARDTSAPPGGWEKAYRELDERFSALSARFAAVETRNPVQLSRAKLEELFLTILTAPQTDEISAGLKQGATQWFTHRFLEAVRGGDLRDAIAKAATEVVSRIATPDFIDRVIHERPLQANRIQSLPELVGQVVEQQLRNVRLSFPR